MQKPSTRTISSSAVESEVDIVADRPVGDAAFDRLGDGGVPIVRDAPNRGAETAVEHGLGTHGSPDDRVVADARVVVELRQQGVGERLVPAAGVRCHAQAESPLGRLDVHAGVVVLGKKTEAGIDRTLELSAFLLDELRAHLATIPARLRDERGATLPIFHTRPGGRLNASNVRNRLLNGTPDKKLPNGRTKAGVKGIVERVNEKRAAEGRMLLPARVTPHTLRRTFASLCFFAGRDLRWVMGQLGHEDPRMTLGVYAQCMKRSQIDEAVVWQLMRFPDEPEDRSQKWPFGPTNGPMTATRLRS
jgi:hypothetical protein